MKDAVLKIKQRFNLIGNSSAFERSIKKALRVANTDISILVTGQSGTGKDVIPRIIHENSARKHGQFIAVNCGAIPEGTIDSELFGHEKGAFTGAINNRRGYFETANNGTIFLDEIGDLPLTTQVRLLRILENGEYLKVGSSKVEKTNVRIIAATNIDLVDSVQSNKFREDLYYRINTIEIAMPSIQERKNDIYLLFRKFVADFTEKHKIPPIKLSEDAIDLIEKYNWPGNIRQLKNFAEKLCVVEEKRNLNASDLTPHLNPAKPSTLMITKNENNSSFSEREILYKILFDLKNDLNDLKKITIDLIEGNSSDESFKTKNAERIQRVYDNIKPLDIQNIDDNQSKIIEPSQSKQNFSLQDNEYEIIRKSLEKNNGKRKIAANELGISERTLYRKIKQYNL